MRIKLSGLNQGHNQAVARNKKEESARAPRSEEPPLSYEEAKMRAGEALQKAVGRLKEKFPPKSLDERAIETAREEARETEEGKAAGEGENGESTAHGESGGESSGSASTGISEYA